MVEDESSLELDMQVTPLDAEGLLLVELDIYRDSRGFFLERYNQEQFREHGLRFDFVQDNHSRSAPGVLRGLHYQHDPPQGKLGGVTRGAIWDVVVDVRPDSETFKQNFAMELSDMNGRLLWIPKGFAHGFCVLGDEPADVLYKATAPYNPVGEKGIFWADEDLAIKWPIRNPIISEKDKHLPSFAEFFKGD
ncbi:MAG TPA: dTDP-4-dehydrorhamnose 3,5-epimerase [Pyrinomonadaceae bacterium]|nr:dTDP-4-dehydrorhamnose 3,5-epimerase [Pyrinomonadaceae bacterium]